MKVVLDTNILVSAMFWNGDSDKIIRLAEEKKVEIILSKDILDELSKVLGYKDIQDKVKDKNLEVRNSFQKIVELATIIESEEKVDIIKDDPADNKFLECAKAGKADFIISKDKHLFNLKKFENISIITPKEFLESRNPDRLRI
jgi:putative PIN family toxin of toxin-antitoxin system